VGSCPNLVLTLDSGIVATGAKTRFRKGPCDDLRVGRKVNVHGLRQPTGIVEATEVEQDK
jgi:hypothetical protein